MAEAPVSVPRVLAETSPSSAKSHLAPQGDCDIHEEGSTDEDPSLWKCMFGEIDFLMLYIGCELSEFGISKTYWLGLERIGVD